jgi:hypothetical protein
MNHLQKLNHFRKIGQRQKMIIICHRVSLGQFCLFSSPGKRKSVALNFATPRPQQLIRSQHETQTTPPTIFHT